MGAQELVLGLEGVGHLVGEHGFELFALKAGDYRYVVGIVLFEVFLRIVAYVIILAYNGLFPARGLGFPQMNYDGGYEFYGKIFFKLFSHLVHGNFSLNGIINYFRFLKARCGKLILAAASDELLYI